MRVLVIGGTGFIGSHTIRALQSDGHDIRALVRTQRPLPDGIEPTVGDATASTWGQGSWPSR